MKRLRDWTDVHFLAAEFMVALLTTVGFALWVAYLGGEGTIRPYLEGKRTTLYATAASIFGALLGFAITGQSILISVSSNERLKIVVESAQYETLWRVFTQAVRWLGIATLFAVVALVVDRDKEPSAWALVVVVGSSLLATIRLVRLICALERLIQLLA